MRIKPLLKILLIVWVCNIANAFAGDIPVYTDEKLNILVESNASSFIVKLKSNPTTGYSWFLREYDSGLIQPVKHTYKSGEENKLIGAGGYEYWTFNVKKAGFIVPQQTPIRFVYSRPWQGLDNSSQVIFRVSTAAK